MVQGDVFKDSSEIQLSETRYRVEVQALAEKLQKRAAREDGEEHPTSEVEEMALGINKLKGCYFIGHTNTDVDSVASAVAGAELYGGTALRSEAEVNGEIIFACEYASYDLPPYIEEVPESYDAFNTEHGLCLVDHNEPGQMHRRIAVAFPQKDSDCTDASAAMQARIHGVIDHHAMCEQFSSSSPIMIDIRPWGSACSILAHNYIRVGRPMPLHVARLLLCGILSDTVNLTSPTTTPSDKLFCTLLAHLAGEENPTHLATQMFKAKTRYLTQLSPFAICRADQKNFTIAGARVGWATIEVTDPEPILAKNDDILLELRILKSEKDLNFAFLSVVDIEKKETKLLLCGSREVALAMAAFGGPLSAAHASTEKFGQLCESDELTIDKTMMDLGSRISRKKEFIPPLKNALSSGWAVPPTIDDIARLQEEDPLYVSVHDCSSRSCSVERAYSPRASRVDNFLTPKLGREASQRIKLSFDAGLERVSSHAHLHLHGRSPLSPGSGTQSMSSLP